MLANANHRSVKASYQVWRTSQTIGGKIQNLIDNIFEFAGKDTDIQSTSEITHRDGGTLSAFLTNLAVLKTQQT